MSSSFRVILFATDKNHTFGLSTLAQFVKIIGGAEGDRTPDLMTASSNQAILVKLKQLNRLQPARIY